MATNDVNLQVINSMTQAQMQSLKDSSGKIPSLANQIIMTDEDDVNLSQLRTEIVYDMSSSDVNKNWGYATGIGNGKVISGKDFSRYDKLIIHATFENTVSGTGILDLSHKLSETGTYRTKLIFGPASSNHVYYYCFVRVDGNKTEFANGDMGYSSTTETGQLSSNTTFISKIEGVLKTPSMIYTGAELYEGEGISIKDGEISAKGYTAGNGINIANGVISASQTYSAEEQFTGNYWIDGKPIYRKCNIITLPSSVNKWNYVWTISSKSLTLLKIYSNLYHSYYEQYPDKAELYSNGKELFENHASDYFNGKQLYVIIEYIYRD